jgi:hypothetical protein
MPMMNRTKRTIKEPAGNSRITLEQAKAAAYLVYRDRLTGRYVMSKTQLTPKQVREAAAKRQKFVGVTPALLKKR